MSGRADLVATIKKAFTIDSSNKIEYILGFVSVFIFGGWFISNTAPLAGLTGKALFIRLGWIRLGTAGVQAEYAKAWADAVSAAVLPTLFLGLSLWYINRLIRREPVEVLGLHLDAPPALPGLIVMLSPYNSRPGLSLPPYGDTNGVVAHLDDAGFRETMLGGRWGPLIVAVQHHARRLRHCWVICTPGEGGSSADFPVAEKVVKKFAPAAECHFVRLLDANDISKIVPQVSAIYNEAPILEHLEPHQIIADFTSGTAAMSGGMILATVENDRRLEYLRQDRPICPGGKALSPAQIATVKPLVTILTTPGMITANQKVS